MSNASPRQRPGFLAAELYGCPTVAAREVGQWGERFWHPLLPESLLAKGQVRALELLGVPLLLTHPPAGGPRAFLNRCPHRGVAFLEPSDRPLACKRLICPYHGWTYDLDGQLRAAAREGEFLAPLTRRDWPLQALPLQLRAGLIWVALAADPVPLDHQLDLVLVEAGPVLERPRAVLGHRRRPLACDWKLAHDNTLDDYHVAIAHPTTLHRDQGPVRHYRHRLGRFANLLATPVAPAKASPPAQDTNPVKDQQQGRALATGSNSELEVQPAEFLTIGLPPWTHLLFWPDGRLAVISFLPDGPSHCQMELWLLGDGSQLSEGEALMGELEAFLAEDQRLVESAQRGYGAREHSQAAVAPSASWPFQPGPPHRLEQRILHHQALYRELMGLDTAIQSSDCREIERRA